MLASRSASSYTLDGPFRSHSASEQTESSATAKALQTQAKGGDELQRTITPTDLAAQIKAAMAKRRESVLNRESSDDDGYGQFRL